MQSAPCHCFERHYGAIAMFRAILILTTVLALAACGRSTTPAPAAPAAVADEVLVDGELEAVHSWLKTGDARDASATRASSAPALPPVEDMIHGLETRLEAEPDDRKGWSLLAQSYAYVGRMADARRAAANAVMLGDDAAALERQIAAAHEGTL